MRADGRPNAQQIRKVEILPNYLKHPAGSVLITVGDTKVICTASVEEKVPPFMRGEGKGWLNAEYSMLPGATETRNRRESAKGKVTGRTMEIQRLIGRSLRAILDLEKLGERSIQIDCDVIQADGGTRTASITGAFVALSLAIEKLLKEKVLNQNPIKESLAAISVGILPSGEAVCDLNYQEDFAALVDMNVVMTESGRFVEVQGTGEEATFSRAELDTLLGLAEQGIQQLIQVQKQVMVLSGAEKPTINAKEILIATKNPGKAEEFRALLNAKGFGIKTLLDFPEIPDIAETGKTFEENARLKAETIANNFGMMVLADDSGLQVDALHGQPGIYSARYAGDDHNDAANNAKLLHELTDVPPEKRAAQFHCTLVLAAPKRESLVVNADVDGVILAIPRGENGFGYDPLFFVPSLQKTMAELSPTEKNKVSHRAKALEKLAASWDNWMTEGAK